MVIFEIQKVLQIFKTQTVIFASNPPNISGWKFSEMMKFCRLDNITDTIVKTVKTQSRKKKMLLMMVISVKVVLRMSLSIMLRVAGGGCAE